MARAAPAAGAGRFALQTLPTFGRRGSGLAVLGGLFTAWALSREWDDDVPTSQAWEDWANHVLGRAWDDAAPTVAPTVSTPANTLYRIWDDEEPI